jgi:DNA-binding XRE family transcriptional regulator
MDKKIPITVHLYKETIQTIESMTTYKNVKNDLKSADNQIHYTIEDFITGCVNLYINQLQNWEEIAGIDDLGKPFRLKNRFKELMIKRELKQKDISDATQIEQSNISNIFKNKNQPSLDYFLRLWVFFGCPPINDVLYREK